MRTGITDGFKPEGLEETPYMYVLRMDVVQRKSRKDEYHMHMAEECGAVISSRLRVLPILLPWRKSEEGGQWQSLDKVGVHTTNEARALLVAPCSVVVNLGYPTVPSVQN